jgi:glycosyltransferase involved in cell wall biosynthesis
MAASARSESDRMRLALFLPELAGGGAERVILSLGANLARRGYPVDLVLVRARGPYLGEISPEVRVVDLRGRRAATSLVPLMRYLRRERPRILLSTLNYANVLAVISVRLARVGTRVIVRQSNTVSFGRPTTGRLAPRVMPWLIRAVYPWADATVAVSEAVADDLARVARVRRDAVRVIPNPIVTPELFRKMHEPPAHGWPSANGIPVILAVGRLTRQKDYPTLIRAFARVSRQRPCRLLILGEGEERAALERLTAELGLGHLVSMPGFVPNPFAYMSRAALVVSSSAWEGLPGVLIQALACGAPVVATDCPGGSREILADGRFGRLVAVGDEAALANAISDVLANPGGAAAEESWRRFSEETSLDRYCDLFEGVAA